MRVTLPGLPNQTWTTATNMTVQEWNSYTPLLVS